MNLDDKNKSDIFRGQIFMCVQLEADPNKNPALVRLNEVSVEDCWASVVVCSLTSQFWFDLIFMFNIFN